MLTKMKVMKKRFNNSSSTSHPQVDSKGLMRSSGEALIRLSIEVLIMILEGRSLGASSA